MQQLRLLVCLVCVASALAQIDPRGARPVEPATRDEKCATQKEWPFCTDDDYGPKCPSGCRIQGLLDKSDHGFLKGIEKVRSLLDQNKAKHRSTDQVSKQTYDYLKEKLTLDAGSNNNYYDLAQSLRQRITDMKIKIDRQMRILAALKDRVKDQVVQMQRLEVDIDIKLRSCKGSCASYSEYQVDRDSFVTLDKQVKQLDAQTGQTVESMGTLYVMKSRPLKDKVSDTVFKSKDVDTSVAAQQREDLFPDVNSVHLILEEEGSSSSPATISKVPVCVRLKQQDQDGRQSPGRTPTTWRQRCRMKPNVPLCSDDDWVSKCPSGCRLHGLISHVENDVERKLRRVCQAVRTHEDAAQKSMMATTRIYNSNRRVVVNRYMSELKFVEHAEGLTRNLTLLRKRSSRLSQQLKELSNNVRKQMEELYRAEVDIDMKLRACRGSCRAALPLGVDHRSFQTLQTEMETLGRRNREATPPADLPRVQLQPVDDGPPPAWPEYKTIPTVQRELLTQFEDIGQNRLALDDLLKPE